MMTRFLETVILIFTAGAVIELGLLIILKRERLASRAVLVLLLLGFLWILFGEMSFYLGNPDFTLWPWRPLIARGACFLAFGRWLWEMRNGKIDAGKLRLPLG